jgi:transposase
MGKKPPSAPKVQKDDFEVQQMKKRIAELEIQVMDAELKAMAFSMMVDLAEKEFNIPIRKNTSAKP